MGYKVCALRLSQYIGMLPICNFLETEQGCVIFSELCIQTELSCAKFYLLGQSLELYLNPICENALLMQYCAIPVNWSQLNIPIHDIFPNRLRYSLHKIRIGSVADEFIKKSLLKSIKFS
ncbi:hypothetical protein T01_11429 [Trichinella spiralis]|uniref:Uncharacterized protein n=1 Tax=Trichinella spiralis TaxID=6334 RepID=A0A0V1B8Q8_TRISP|nr:hypothetical protein T01_11429 [Trichinella spiralis]